MYTHGPGSNIVPRGESAITESALGMPRAVSVVPSSGSTAMSTSGARAVADPLAVEEHRRLVLLALADHDDAVHVDAVEHVAHRVDRGGVGRLLVAAADQPRGAERRRLGHADQLEREVAVRAGCALARSLTRASVHAGASDRRGRRETITGARGRRLIACAAWPAIDS